MAPLNLDEFKNWYASLSDTDRMIFLALVSGRLTIHGRSFGIDLTGEEQIKAFKGLNELQHLVSFHFAGIGANHDRYPNDAFLHALFERATSFGLSAHLRESLEYAKSRHNWGTQT